MAIKFQYNKTSLQQLEKQLKIRIIEKQLKIRIKALPTLKNKESALRLEVKKAKDEVNRLNELVLSKFKQYEDISNLWNEFNASLIKIKDVELGIKKIAGVKTPVLNKVIFEEQEFSLFNNQKWFLDGISILKEIVTLSIEREVFQRKMELLDHSRKKTTQKVNLFEKVQIPGYEEAIRKIKRFLEDEDNLSKSAQKIVKNKQQTELEV